MSDKLDKTERNPDDQKWSEIDATIVPQPEAGEDDLTADNPADAEAQGAEPAELLGTVVNPEAAQAAEQEPFNGDATMMSEGPLAEDRTFVGQNPDDPDLFEKTLVFPAEQVVAPASDSSQEITGTVVLPVTDEEFQIDKTLVLPAGQQKSGNPPSGKPSGDIPIGGDTVVMGREGDAGTGGPADRSSGKPGSKPPAGTPGKGTAVLPERQSGSGSVSGSRSAAKIWQDSGSGSLQDVVTIRSRKVSGGGVFGDDANADFEIIQKLAEGGMGVVYVAKQNSLNRELAIKTLKAPGGGGSQASQKPASSKVITRAERQRREMFISEALVTANLVHPNIIPIHELAQTDDGNPYYVMKRVHGVPWSSRIAEMSQEENLEILHKVCDAVAYAHHHGVINRDLKPENIMLGEFGEVLVLDWGLAVPAPHAVSPNFQSPVASFGAGTPAYMAPELWTGPPSAIGEWSDIYLLGAILFEVVTATPPHDFAGFKKSGTSSDPWRAVDAVLRENLIRESSVTGELMDIARKAMHADPQQRHSSVLEFQFAIQNFQRHEESRHLSRRADELVTDSGTQERSYQTYQAAATLYDESLRMWTGNTPAAAGLQSTRLRYAEMAYRKGDYDLGLQITAQESGPEFVTLARRLNSAKRLRSGLKWTTLTAVLSVVLLGAKSIYDNGIITDLNTQVTARKAEADRAVQTARAAEQEAADASQEAMSAIAQADAARNEAQVALADADRSRNEAMLANQQAADAKKDAETALTAAATAKNQAESAVAEAEAANRRVVKANEDVQLAETRQRAAQARQEEAEIAARIAQVEIQSQSIRGLTLNENYSDALREVERLLNGDLLTQLPETVRQQRRAELEAQREQLLKRVRQTEAPVQTQSVSPDGTLLALGDSSGLVTVVSNPGSAMEWPQEARYSRQFPNDISELKFLESDRLLIVSGQSVLIWELAGNDEPFVLTGHTAPIRGFDVIGTTAITGDDDGTVIVWNLTTRQVRTQIRANTRIRDVALVPGTSIFVYAGVRGGQSADVLAYRMPDEADSTQRPTRLGQLRMPRTHTAPPQRISVSPDGALLILSSSVDGDLIVLPAVQESKETNTRQFPFVHPADLEKAGQTDWIVRQHRRPVNEITWSRDGRWMITASDDRSIGVWKRAEQAEEARTAIPELQQFLRGHGARVFQAMFLNNNATRLVSSSADRCSRLWDLTTIETDRREIRRAFDLSRVLPERPDRGEANAVAERAKRRPPGGYILTSFRNGTDSQEAVPEQSAVPPKSPGDEAVPEAIMRRGDHAILNAESRLHRGPIRAVRFSNRGDSLVTGAADGSVVLWDPATRRAVTRAATEASDSAGELFREGHEFNVAAMEILNVSGGILATSGFDGSLRLWNMDIESGRAGVQQRAIAGLGLVNTFAVSADGQYLITSASEDSADAQKGSCSVWLLRDVLSSAAATPIASLRGLHRNEVTALAVSRDGHFVATGARDGVVGVWSLQDYQLRGSVRAHVKNTIVSSLCWLPDGSFVSAGLDGQLLQWEWDNAPVAQSTTSGGSVVASESVAGQGRTDSAPGGVLNRRASLTQARIPIEDVFLSPDHSQLVVLTVETDRRTKQATGHIDLWRLEPTEGPKRIHLGLVDGRSPRTISSASWSGDGKRLLVCAEGRIQILDTTDWKVLKVLGSERLNATDAQFASELSARTGRDLIATFDGNAAQLWDLAEGSHVASFRGPFPIDCLAFGGDDDDGLLLSGGVTLRVFDGNVGHTLFGQPLFRAQSPHRGRVLSMDLCPTQRELFVTTGSEGTALLWRWVSSRKQAVVQKSLWSHSSPLVSVRWSPGGDRLLLVGSDGWAGIVTTEGQLLLTVKPGLTEDLELFCGEYSHDGRHVVVAGRVSGTAESAGWVFPCEDSATQSVTSSTESRPSSGSEAGIQQSVPNMTPVCRFSGHGAGGITSAAFVRHSPYLVSGGTDGALILWNWQQPLPGEVDTAYEAYRFMTEDQLTAHRAAVTAVSISAAGQIASASDDGTIILWTNPVVSQTWNEGTE